MDRIECSPWSAIVTVLGVCWAVGCGGPDYKSIAQQAAEKVAQAEAAANNGDYDTAAALLTEALKSGGVGRDGMAGACRLRALCLVELGEFPRAIKDANTLIDASPNLADALAVRAFVLRASGKSAEAAATFREARRIDRNVQQVSGLDG